MTVPLPMPRKTTEQWRTVLDVRADGIPHPQGSKDAHAIYRGRGADREFTGKVAMTERHGGGKLKVWRRAVALAVSAAWVGPPVDGPVRLTVEFVMPRPKSAPKRKSPVAIRRPDLDKLARSTLDGIQAGGAYTDDARVVALVASKRLAEIGESPGARIVVAVPDEAT